MNKDYHQIRLTVDYKKDLIVINILKEIKNINKFGLKEINNYIKKEIFFQIVFLIKNL